MSYGKNVITEMINCKSERMLPCSLILYAIWALT